MLGVYASTGAREFANLYVCPEGKATIVKSCLVTNFSTIAAAIEVSIRKSGNPLRVFLLFQTLEPTTPLHWEGWVMMEPSDELLIQANTPSVLFWASGAELTAQA